MREEIELILKMLEEGKISTEESAKLIEAIQKPEDNEQYETVNDVMDSMADMSKHIGEMSAKLGKEIISSYESAATGVVDKEARVLEGPLNPDSDIYISTTGRLRFTRLEENKRKVRISVRLDQDDVDKFDDIIKFSSGEGCRFEVVGYEKPVHVEIWLPDMQFNKIVGIGKNGRIEFDMLNAESIELASSNGKIIGKNTKAETIDIATSNAKIVLETCFGETLDIATSNGKINISDCAFEDSIEAATSNGAINMVDTVTSSVELATANGPIRFEGNKLNSCELVTTNGKIFIKGNDVYNDKVVDIMATTSQGDVTVLVPGNMGAAFKADTHNSGNIQLGKFLKPVEWKVRDGKNIFEEQAPKESRKSKTYFREAWEMSMNEMGRQFDKKPDNLVYAVGESKWGRRGDTYSELNLKTTMGNISIGWG